MTSGLSETQKHAGTARKVRKQQICSNKRSKMKNTGRETVKLKRPGEAAR